MFLGTLAAIIPYYYYYYYYHVKKHKNGLQKGEIVVHKILALAYTKQNKTKIISEKNSFS